MGQGDDKTGSGSGCCSQRGIHDLYLALKYKSMSPDPVLTHFLHLTRFHQPHRCALISPSQPPRWPPLPIRLTVDQNL